MEQKFFKGLNFKVGKAISSIKIMKKSENAKNLSEIESQQNEIESDIF